MKALVKAEAEVGLWLEDVPDISPVITHRLPYTDFEEGFKVMNRGECGKVILSWRG